MTQLACRVVAVFGAIILSSLSGTSPGLASETEASPIATPPASPVAMAPGCEGLDAYFQALADLTIENEGLVLLRSVNFDVLRLSDAQAATVVTALDALLPTIRAISAPEPATAYHEAYLGMIEWYRAMALERDQASHQRLINDDRRIFSAMGQAFQIGQSSCGYAAWTDAWNAAFLPAE